MLLLDQNNVKIFLSSIVLYLIYFTVTNFSRTMHKFIYSDVRRALKLAMVDIKAKAPKVQRETEFLRFLCSENKCATF